MAAELSLFSAVLLDIDGTLLDSNAAHADAWFHALRDHGFAVDLARIRPLIGMGGDKFLPEVANLDAESRKGKAVAERKQELFGEHLPHLQPTPGGRALVEYLKSQTVDIAVATSADDEEVSALLERAGVADLIPKRAGKDDDTRSKPDPDIVLAALACTHASAPSAVLVGDTPYDIEAASRAGVRAIALRCGGYWSDDAFTGAIGIFDDPAALVAHWQGGRP